MPETFQPSSTLSGGRPNLPSDAPRVSNPIGAARNLVLQQESEVASWVSPRSSDADTDSDSMGRSPRATRSVQTEFPAKRGLLSRRMSKDDMVRKSERKIFAPLQFHLAESNRSRSNSSSVKSPLFGSQTISSRSGAGGAPISARQIYQPKSDTVVRMVHISLQFRVSLRILARRCRNQNWNSQWQNCPKHILIETCWIP